MMKNHVSVRLDPETLARVDALIPAIKIAGRLATRSDVLRALVLSGLDVREASPSAGQCEERDD